MWVVTMPILFNCPLCSHRLKVPDDAAGKRGKCPACGVRVAIPHESEDSGDFPIPLDAALATSLNPSTPSKPGPIPSGLDSDADLVIPPSAIVSTSASNLSQSPHQRLHPQSIPVRVVVVDFDMKFASIVGLLVKFALAAIPAIVITSFKFLLIFIIGYLTLVPFVAWLSSRS
jgi:hypothetical protein